MYLVVGLGNPDVKYLKTMHNMGFMTVDILADNLNVEFNKKAFKGVVAETFVNEGGHQLQLNVIDKTSLVDAQLHPENYKNLIVRVWGWSGYFVELDKCYQDQIIRRADYSL